MIKILKLFNKILKKLTFRKIIYFKKSNNKMYAFIYYKTESFIWQVFKKENHTNNYEIILMVKTLLGLGYNTFLVDRNASKAHISKIKQKNFDILLTNISGNSAPNNVFIQSNFNFKSTIAYVGGPEPNFANSLRIKRHNEFQRRVNPKEIIYRRIVRGSKKELSKRFKNVDSIFYIGNKFSENSYKIHQKPLFRIYPSISQTLNINLNDLIKKDKKRFIYFGGSGCICKGLDLVIDSVIEVLKYEEIFLDICAPENELDFWREYQPKISNNDHINYYGFIDINSKNFLNLTTKAAFNIFPASSEGSATSVLTCMRRSLIPVVTYEAGIDVKDFGYLLKSNNVEEIKYVLNKCIKISDSEFQERLIKTYNQSWNYSPEMFVNSFRNGILNNNTKTVSKL